MPASYGVPRQFVVWLPTGIVDPWRMQAARVVERPLAGGERSMHELAVAIAALGHAVEIRGTTNPEELARLAGAAETTVALADAERATDPNDVILVPEGTKQHEAYSQLLLSGARVIVVALAPTGLFGWAFVDGWAAQPIVGAPVDSVGRPEHLRALHGLGLELWTHMPELERRARQAGVPCALIGTGQPAPPPAPTAARVYDVATIRHNRWAQAANVALEALPAGVSRVAIEGTNAEVLAQLARSRVLIHPMRVEGHSRLAWEARLMGAVPVVLSSNVFAVGADETGGGISVETVSAIAPAVVALLADPERWAQLSQRAMRTARTQVDWAEYRARVAAAIDGDPRDPAAGARVAIGRMLVARERALEGQLAAAEAARDAADAEHRATEAQLTAERDALADELHGVYATRAWRTVLRLWALRDRVLHGPPAAPPPPPPPPPAIPVPGGWVIEPADGAVVAADALTVAGWALHASGPATRVDVTLGDLELGRARLGIPRRDVRDATGRADALISGFELFADGEVPVGPAVLRVTATGVDGEQLELPPVSLTITAAAPAPVLAPRRAAMRRTTSPRRVVAVVHDLRRGGAQLYLRDLLVGLAAQDRFELEVLALGGGPLRAELEALGIVVSQFAMPVTSDATRYAEGVAELAAWARRGAFDVAIVNAFMSHAAADALYAIGVPTAWVIHESRDPPLLWRMFGLGEPEVRARVQRSLREARHGVFVAEATRELYAWCMPGDRGSAVAPGVGRLAQSTPDQEAARRALGIAADATLIACVGTVEARKSQIPLVHAFSLLAADDPTLTLALIGASDTEYADSLREFAATSCPAGRVLIEPVIEDVAPWVAAADLVVSASDMESLPRSLIEAMACERPVLATAVFGVPELIEDGETGWLVAPRDTGALVEALRRVLALPAAERARVARAGRDVALARYDSAAHAERFADLLKSIAAAPQ